MKFLPVAVLACGLALPSIVHAAWPAGGVRLDPYLWRWFSDGRLLSDGPGRMTVTFRGHEQTYVYPLARHVLLDGTQGSAFHGSETAVPFSDGADGYFVADYIWTDGPTWATSHVLGPGGPDPAWPPGSVATPSTGAPVAAPDGAGGVYVATLGSAAHLRHFDATGSPVAGWPDEGIALTQGAPGGSPLLVRMHVDAAGRATVLLVDDSNTLRTHRYLPDGTPDPAWMGDALAPSAGDWSLFEADGSLFALWADADTRIARLGPLGELEPGWPVLAIGGGDFPHTRAFGDGAGGAYVFCQPGTQEGHVPAPVFATHLLAGGGAAPGWSAPGTALALPGTGVVTPLDFFTGPDGLGGAFFGWGVTLTRLLPDHGIASGWSASGDLVAPDPPLPPSDQCPPGSPTAVFAAHAVVGDGTGAALVVVSVADCSYFQALRLIRFTPAGLAGVASGSSRAGFAIRLLGANPAAGSRRFAFTIDPAAPATFEVVDVTGRVASREFVAPGAAARELSWEPAAGAAPGVYFARIVQRGSSRVTRMVVLE